MTPPPIRKGCLRPFRVGCPVTLLPAVTKGGNDAVSCALNACTGHRLEARLRDAVTLEAVRATCQSVGTARPPIRRACRPGGGTIADAACGIDIYCRNGPTRDQV